MTHNNICTMGIPEEDSEQGIKNLTEEIMTENLPNLVMEKTHKSRKLRVANKLDRKRPTPLYIIIKMARLKDKERILKASREKAGSCLHRSTN